MGREEKPIIKFRFHRFGYYVGYVALLLLYFVTEYLTRKVSNSNSFLTLGNQRLPFMTLAGVFSSMSAVILISLVIFYQRFGFYTSLVITFFRIINIISPAFIGRLPNMSGIFTTLFALVSIILVYKGNERVRHIQEEQRQSLEQFTQSITNVLVNCIDGKDSYTNGHSIRVAKYTKMLARKLGEKRKTCNQFYNIALLHDVGKIGIPESILTKPGKLTEEESEIMKSHAQRGYEILKEVKVLEGIADGAHYHHEKFDGSGYPDKIAGKDIPWIARIIAVADTLDAMSSTRPYRKKLSMDFIVEEITRCSGSQFDPRVVKAFLDLYNEGAFDDLKENQK